MKKIYFLLLTIISLLASCYGGEDSTDIISIQQVTAVAGINNDTYKLSGDYEQVIRQILDFAQSHKPDGLKRYEALKAQPHEPGKYGDFETLPTELERYAISKP